MQAALPRTPSWAFFMGLYYSFAVLVVAEILGAKYMGLGWYIQFKTNYSGYANVYVTLIIMSLICAGLCQTALCRAGSPSQLAGGVYLMVARGAALLAGRSSPGAKRYGRHLGREPFIRSARLRAARFLIRSISES